MNRMETQNLTPIQPYVLVHADDYESLMGNTYGISRFYEFTVKKEHENKLQAVPDGSVDLLFSIGRQKVRTYIGGTVLKAKHWPLFDGVTYFGVRFQPGKCQLPKELSISEIVNADIEISGNSFGENLAEQIAEGRNMQERSRIFLKKYKEMLVKSEEKDVVHSLEAYVRNRIYSCKGNITIQALAQETGYSECYIRRIFHSVHGISPKVFEKFVRFQYLLNQMNQKSNQLTIDEIAMECGYYDQSHMMKDFKNFTGITPEAYQNMMAVAEFSV